MTERESVAADLLEERGFGDVAEKLCAVYENSVEVPVTKRLRVCRVARDQLRDGDRYVVRPWAGAPWRHGIGVAGRGGYAIAAECVDDLVYKIVEDPK